MGQVGLDSCVPLMTEIIIADQIHQLDDEPYHQEEVSWCPEVVSVFGCEKLKSLILKFKQPIAAMTETVWMFQFSQFSLHSCSRFPLSLRTFGTHVFTAEQNLFPASIGKRKASFSRRREKTWAGHAAALWRFDSWNEELLMQLCLFLSAVLPRG